MLETSMGDIQLELYWDHAPKVGQPHASRLFNSHLNECTGSHARTLLN